MADLPPESPKPDPTELLHLPPMTRQDIGNLMACVDGVLRGRGLEVAETCMRLAEKLAAAKPVNKPNNTRRGK